MFEHFTFGAQAHTLYPQQEEDFASPTDTSCILTQQPPSSFPFPESPANPAINDLLNKLTNQTLVPEESEVPTTWTATLVCPANEEEYAENCELPYISSRRGLTKWQPHPNTALSSSRAQTKSPCIRSQRQLNTQLQSCTDHTKDISTLVEDMIATNEQCTVYAAPSTSTFSPPPPTDESRDSLSMPSSTTSTPVPTTPPQIIEPAEDEGFCELDDTAAIELLLSQREQQIESRSQDLTSLQKASAPSGIRKFGVTRYGLYQSYSCGKAVGSSNLTEVNDFMPREEGRQKVRCLPRMRIRREKGRVKARSDPVTTG